MRRRSRSEWYLLLAVALFCVTQVELVLGAHREIVAAGLVLAILAALLSLPSRDA